MAQTTAADMIVPEVWADMVQAEFQGKLVLGGLATSDNTLVGNPGDTVHFPKFGALSDISADQAEGTPLVPETLSTSDDTGTIKEIGKAVEFTDKSLLTGHGDPLAEGRRQLGVLVARKIDVDLRTVAEAAGADTAPSTAAVISWDAFVDGFATFGDEWDPENLAGAVIHSKQHADLMKDATFISADKVNPNERPTVRGFVGRVGAVNVFMSDRTTKVTDGGGVGVFTYKALPVERNALGVLWKRRPVVETDRDILARSTVVTTNVHYGVKRLKNSGICVVETQ
jgi:N4-gp56 family major capsid protein